MNVCSCFSVYNSEKQLFVLNFRGLSFDFPIESKFEVREATLINHNTEKTELFSLSKVQTQHITDDPCLSHDTSISEITPHFPEYKKVFIVHKVGK